MSTIKENPEYIHEKGEIKSQIHTLRTDIDIGNRKEIISHYSELLHIKEVQVENALKSLDSAFLRLQANPYFRKQYGNFHPYSVLPLIAKESFLDNARVSSTGAIGYFQLKPDAIDDVKKILISFGIQKEYDPKNPVDNCILGLLYFDNTKYRLIKELDSIQVGEEFTYLAYNGGVKRTKALIEKYQKESGHNRIEWRKFALWMASLLEKSPKEETVHSKEYGVQYRKWLKQDWRNDTTLIPLGENISIKKSKIEEMLNYVEKISALEKRKKENKQSNDVPRKAGEGKVIKPEISPTIKYQKNYDIFHGDGPIDNISHAIGKTFGTHEQYLQIQSITGQGISKMLEGAGIEATQEAINEFREINHLDQDDIIVVGAYYLLPKKPGRSVSGKIEPKRQDANIEKERLDRDFYKWLESIEVKNHSLRGKLFILDPGHGGIDPGSIPMIHDETGKSVPFKNSDISLSGKATKNGKGDGYFHIIESKITMDIAYRIAKKIRENGGEVKITHYFQKGIDNGIQNPWNPLYEKQGNLDEQERYDTWGDGEKKAFQEGSTDGLKKRVELRNNFQKGKKPENTYFISIHADSLPHDKNEGILVMHSQKHSGQKDFARELASSIGFVRNKPALAGSREKGIYVLDAPGALSQNVLIELGNMNNKNTSYALRLGETREEYAEGIFEGLKKLAVRK